MEPKCFAGKLQASPGGKASPFFRPQQFQPVPHLGSRMESDLCSLGLKVMSVKMVEAQILIGLAPRLDGGRCHEHETW